jgi:hypothetical protein
MAKEATSIKGSCLCRSIQYELRGAPFANILCHCDNCRKACGSPFVANSRYAKDQLNITLGQDLLRTFDDARTDSGVRDPPCFLWYLWLAVVHHAFHVPWHGFGDGEVDGRSAERVEAGAGAVLQAKARISAKG